MGKRIVKILFALAIVIVLIALAWAISRQLSGDEATTGRDRGPKAAPVEVQPVTQGLIEDVRVFSGTLNARAELTVAPRVAGRLETLAVDLGDPVTRGQLLAEIDDAEFVQDVAQAQAELAVARAQQVEAQNALEVAQREFSRVQTLRERGVASESQLDTLQAQMLARESELQVANAQVSRAESSLESARIRLSYTQVHATWSGEDEQRIVGQRFVDEGNIISENQAILSIVALDPIKAEMFVTERDYGRLQAGQAVTLVTDAYPGETFEGRISRISPVFRMASRQARVELMVDNPDMKLKPGLFVRARVRLQRLEDATIVPVAALVKRGGAVGVFIVNDDGETVRWQPVRQGIRAGDRVQVTSADEAGRGIRGQVVTLGQQLVEDGSPILVPEMETPSQEEVAALAAQATRAN